MSQVNINAAQPPSSNPPPGRPFRWWPIAVFIILLGIVAIVFAARQVSQNNSAKATATPGTVAADTATAGEEAVASSTPGSGATSTPTAAPGATATGSGSGGNAQPPTNPTALHVTSGSCTSHQIAWTWSGAQRATSYEVVLYDPRTGATIRDTTTPDTAYMLQAGPGATVALKVRSHNAAGTGQCGPRAAGNHESNAHERGCQRADANLVPDRRPARHGLRFGAVPLHGEHAT